LSAEEIENYCGGAFASLCVCNIFSLSLLVMGNRGCCCCKYQKVCERWLRFAPHLLIRVPGYLFIVRGRADALISSSSAEDCGEQGSCNYDGIAAEWTRRVPLPALNTLFLIFPLRIYIYASSLCLLFRFIFCIKLGFKRCDLELKINGCLIASNKTKKSGLENWCSKSRDK